MHIAQARSVLLDFGAPGGASLEACDVDGVLTVSNANTVVGYCRYDATGEIEYVFVGRDFRRQGVARAMLAFIGRKVGKPLRFRDPISPLGEYLVRSYKG